MPDVVTFDEVLDAIEHLPVEKQADLVDVVRRRLAERGRQRIVAEARKAKVCKTKVGTGQRCREPSGVLFIMIWPETVPDIFRTPPPFVRPDRRLPLSLLCQDSSFMRGIKAIRFACVLDLNYLLQDFQQAKIDA